MTTKTPEQIAYKHFPAHQWDHQNAARMACLAAMNEYGDQVRRETVERHAKAMCRHCRQEPDAINGVIAEPEVQCVEAQYVPNYGNIETGYAHKGKYVKWIPCDASDIFTSEMEADVAAMLEGESQS